MKTKERISRKIAKAKKTLATIALAGALVGCDPIPKGGDRVEYLKWNYFIDTDNDGDVDVVVDGSDMRHRVLYYDPNMASQLIIGGYNMNSFGQQIMTPEIKESATRAFNGLKDFYHAVDSTKK